jgi:GDP-L-fucose synthase
MVGSAIFRRLRVAGYHNIVGRSSSELDLTCQADVDDFFAQERPDHVFLAAARVGGIAANNTYRGEFIYENLMIQTNVIHAAWKHGVDRLLFLGSSCIYPRECEQPIQEEYLLNGPLELTNEPYAVAKISGIKMCEAYKAQYGARFMSVMSTNLYGPNDNYDLNDCHVLPALLRKVHEAQLRGDKEVVVWGSGNPRREFMYVDDMADACVFLMERELVETRYNVGIGEDTSIRELTQMIMDTVGFEGQMVFDASRPDGTPRKLLNVSRMGALGWKAKITLQDGLMLTYRDFLSSSVAGSVRTRKASAEAAIAPKLSPISAGSDAETLRKRSLVRMALR